MRWDASRPVPWGRLLKEYAIYAGIMAVILEVLFRDRGVAGLVAGLVVAGPIYVGLGAVLAKFGYQRKSLAGMGTPRAGAEPAAAVATTPRGRPTPTKRTTTGPSQRKRKR